MYICGVDEAGRGPVIGPMVICAYLIDKNKESKLKDLGVKDSKELSQKKRAFLQKKLLEIGKAYIKIIDAKDIDSANKDKISLNTLELIAFSNIVKELSKNKDIEKVFIDCPDTNTERFCRELESLSKVKAVCEHKADSKYLCVAAASIIAKVERDKIIEEIKKESGIDFGSGYPSDPLTKKALPSLIEKKNSNIRHSWKTTKKAKKELESKSIQSKL